MHGGFVEVSNDTGDDPVRRGRAGRARSTSTGPGPAKERAEQRAAADHDAEADAAVKRAHVRLAAAGGLAAAH